MPTKQAEPPTEEQFIAFLQRKALFTAPEIVIEYLVEKGLVEPPAHLWPQIKGED